MLERGEATAEDIDTAMKLGAGYRKWSCERGGSLSADSDSHGGEQFPGRGDVPRDNR